MTWTTLHAVQVEEFLSRDTRKTGEALNRDIEKLLAQRKAADGLAGKSGEEVVAGLEQKQRVLDALTFELDIRQRIGQYLTARLPELEARRVNLFTKAEALRNEWRAKLVDAGFPPSSLALNNLLAEHRDHVSAMREADALSWENGRCQEALASNEKLTRVCEKQRDEMLQPV